MGALTAPVPVPSAAGGAYGVGGGHHPGGFCQLDATGWMSIPTTFSCNFFRVSVRDKLPEWLRMSLDRCFDERPTAAGWIEHPLAQGGVNYGLSDFLRQPAGCVVLTQALSFFLRDHVLVKRGRLPLSRFAPNQTIPRLGRFRVGTCFLPPPWAR